VAYCCVGSLAALGEAVPDPAAAIGYLQAGQQASGAFKIGRRKQQPYSETQATFNAVRSLHLLGAAPRDPQACVAALQGWQIDARGFDDATYQIRAALAERPRLSGGQHDVVSRGWARHVPISHLFRTTVTVLTLALLGTGPRDKARCRRRIAELWSPGPGWFLEQQHCPPTYGSPSVTRWGLLAAFTFGVLRPAPANLPELATFSHLSLG